MGRLVRRYVRTSRLYAVNKGIFSHFGAAGGGYAITALGLLKSGITMSGWWTPLYASAEVESGAVWSAGAIAAIFCEMKVNQSGGDAWAFYIANNGTVVPKGAIRISGNFDYVIDFAQTSNAVAATGDKTVGGTVGGAGLLYIQVAGANKYIQLYD